MKRTWVCQNRATIAGICHRNLGWKTSNGDREAPSLTIRSVVVHGDFKTGALEPIEAVMVHK